MVMKQYDRTPLLAQVALIALLASAAQAQTTYNWISPTSGTENWSVQEVVDRFIKTWGSGTWEDLSDPRAVHEAAVLQLCCDKAAARLGWRNALSMEQAIDLTAEWYKMFYSGASQEVLYHLCTKQIAKYVKTARERTLRWTEK